MCLIVQEELDKISYAYGLKRQTSFEERRRFVFINFLYFDRAYVLYAVIVVGPKYTALFDQFVSAFGTKRVHHVGKHGVGEKSRPYFLYQHVRTKQRYAVEIFGQHGRRTCDLRDSRAQSVGFEMIALVGRTQHASPEARTVHTSGSCLEE
jgi:hypothetical protein